MPGARQDILVKIRALVEGLADVRELGRHLGKIQAGGTSGQGTQPAALAGNLDKLTLAVDRLATASEKANSKGGLFRFLVGVSAVVNTLSNIPQAFEGIRRLLDFFDNISGPLGAALGSVFGKVKEGAASLGTTATAALAGAGARIGPALAGIGSAAAELGAALTAALPVILAVAAALAALAAVFTPLLIGFGGLAGAVAAGAAALAFIAARGLAFQRQMEQVRLGIAAVITSLAQIKDSGGLPVEGAEKFRLAMQLSAEQLQKLKVDAINTTATFGQIAPAFQAAIGPGLAAKLTLDEIREITVKVVQAAGALGLPLNQVNQEVRAILEGTINEDARLAKVLGLSNEMVKSWKQQGTLAEELNKRLAGFAVAGEEAAGTLDGLTSNLEEALDVFSGEATRRAFDALKAEFARLLPQLFDFKNAGIAGQFKSLAELADEVLVRLIQIGGVVVQSIVNGVKRVADFVSRNRELIDEILNLAGGVVRQVLSIVGYFGRLLTDTNSWRGGLEIVRGVLVLINGILAAVGARLREIEPLLRLAVLAALAAGGANFATLAAGQAGSDPQLQRNELRNEREVALNDLAVRKAALSPAELRRRGFGPPELTVTPSGGGGGGGKKAARRSQLEELTAQAEDAALATDRARIERAFNLARDFLERQQEHVERLLDERRISIERYYTDEERIQRETIEAEIKKVNELYANEEQKRDAAKRRIDADKDLTKPEKEQKKTAAEEEFKQTVIPLVERLTVLDRERLDLAGRIAAERRKEAEAFEAILRDVNEQLALETGDTGGAAEAARRRIEEANKERLERIAAEKGAASTEYQQATQLVEVLKKKAEYQLLYNDLQQKAADLAFAEGQIRNDVRRGVLTEKQGREQVTKAQLEHKTAIEETIAKLRELAVATGDPKLILDAEKAAEGVKDLGRVVDERWRSVAREVGSIFEDFFMDLEQGFGAATRNMLLAFVQMVQRMVAEALAAQLVKKLFGTTGEDEDESGGGGLLGGAFKIIPFIGGLFGGFKFGGGGNFGGAGAGGSYSAGGPITGPGTETSDSILARVSKGEFVIRAAAARMLGPGLLDFINRFGRLPVPVIEPPRFAFGGAVGDVLDTAGRLEPERRSAAGPSPVRVEAHFHGVKDVNSFQENERAIKRKLMHAVRSAANPGDVNRK